MIDAKFASAVLAEKRAQARSVAGAGIKIRGLSEFGPSRHVALKRHILIGAIDPVIGCVDSNVITAAGLRE